MRHPSVVVLGCYASIRVRDGALDIVHGPHEDKRSLRFDVDSPKPHTILLDSHGEFITGEALRWLSRYGVGLILPNGPGRMLTFLDSALEATDGASQSPDIDPSVLKAQCAAACDENRTVSIARAIVRAKIEAEISHLRKHSEKHIYDDANVSTAAFEANSLADHLDRLDEAASVPQIVTIEAHSAACYWRAFRDMGLQEAKGGNLPRSWLRFANRNKGAQFLGNKHAQHPINAMLNYAYVVEAGRLAKALAAHGLALPIGFLHADRKGRNSLVWDAIEPLRPVIDAGVFSYIQSREFARADFPQTGATTFRLSRDVIQSMLREVSLSPGHIGDAADFVLRAIERHAGGEYRLFKADLRTRKRDSAKDTIRRAKSACKATKQARRARA
jgi:CRISP-associated protein Cas1